jgi:hypothetical protein
MLYRIYYNAKGIEDGTLTVNARNKKDASKNAHIELQDMFKVYYYKVKIKSICPVTESDQ